MSAPPRQHGSLFPSRLARAGADISLYNIATRQVNYREESSPALLGSAIIASRPVKFAGRPVTLYGGASRLTPMGRVVNPVFTSSIKVTERNYAPWVKARQDQMEANVVGSWERDPLIVQRPNVLGKGTSGVHANGRVN